MPIAPLFARLLARPRTIAGPSPDADALAALGERMRQAAQGRLGRSLQAGAPAACDQQHTH